MPPVILPFFDGRCPPFFAAVADLSYAWQAEAIRFQMPVSGCRYRQFYRLSFSSSFSSSHLRFSPSAIFLLPHQFHSRQLRFSPSADFLCRSVRQTPQSEFTSHSNHAPRRAAAVWRPPTSIAFSPEISFRRPPIFR